MSEAIIETVEKNPTIDMARSLIERTGINLFLTGKAGTGKTTFLRELRETSRKRIVVVAPTGIAAINAGGVTIHSFFQLDFNSAPDEFRSRRFDKFSKSKLNMIRSVDLLVIDEVSMVRADLLDRVDEVLRRHRNPRRPFGGVQLLLIGDLHQLPPVVTDREASTLMEKYQSPYFFESEALKQAGFVTLELTKVYRQKDSYFIGLLNAIRTNTAGRPELDALNSCVGKVFEDGTKSIRLVTHNYQAQKINEHELALLSGPPIFFNASIEGKFPESSIPGEMCLELKKGAQVMFIKNDLVNHDWYNGLLAEVTDLSEDHIRVRTVEGKEITVRREEWVNNSYSLDEEKGEIKEVREGAFHQYPLRLAWAITIHKSQGLTFDRAVIDATNAFAHGQTYVALSRCRSLEGLALERPLYPQSIITDQAVRTFMEAGKANQVNEANLSLYEKEYCRSLLTELFDFTELELLFGELTRLLGRLPKQYLGLTEECGLLNSKLAPELILVSRKLESWFPHFIVRTPGVNADSKIKAGAGYFVGKLKPLQQFVSRIPLDIENKEVKKRLEHVTLQLIIGLDVKAGLLENFSKESFSTDSYLRLKSRIENEAINNNSKTKRVKTSASVDNRAEHPDLEKLLKNWRAKVSKEKALPAFRILSNNAVRSVANGVPDTHEQLKSLRNIGEFIASQYGEELLEIVKKWKEKSVL